MYRQGRYAEALAELGALAGDGLPGRVGRFYQGMCHRAIGIEALANHQFATAEQHLRKAVDSLGRGGDLTKYLASLYAGTGRFSRCAEEMETVARLDPNSAEARRHLAVAQWRQGNRPQAYMTLTQALRQLGHHCQLHLQLGMFYAAEEQYDQACASLAEAVQADGANAEAHYYLALAVAARGDALAAVQSFQRALELRGDDLLIAYQLALAARAAEQAGGTVLVRLPSPAAASGGSHIRQLARYICREGDFVEAFLSLPASEMDAELFGVLDSVLQMAIEEHSHYADLHYYRSCVLGRLGRIDAAIDHARRAIALNPKYTEALIRIGKLQADCGRAAEAIENLTQAIKCGGDWADVHCLLGELLGGLNKPQQAADHLRRALEINTGYTRAAEALTALAA